MLQRVRARRRHVAVVRQVAGRVEPGVRIAAFVPAIRHEVLQRIDAGGRDVRIVEHIVFGIEARDQRADRIVGGASFRLAEAQEVAQRIAAARRDIGVVHQIKLPIEVRPRIAPFLPAGLLVLRQRIGARRANVRIGAAIQHA